MRVVVCIILLLVSLTSCWNDDHLFTFPPEQALTGEWEISEGEFLWDNDTRISTINPVFESRPAVSMQFADGQTYLVTYSFVVTNNSDTVTITNGLQEGNFQISVGENNVLMFEGEIMFTENTTNAVSNSKIQYSLGNPVDTLWIEGLELNNLLQGEINGIFIRDNRE